VVSRKRVQRLMRQVGLSGLQKVKRGRSTIRVPGVRVADDLVERRFRPRPARRAGSPTSPTCARGRAGCISPPSRTPTRGASSAGRWPTTCAPSSSSTHSRWLCTGAGRVPGSFITPTRARNTSLWLRPEGPRRGHRHLDGLQRLRLRQRRRRELLRDAQEGTRPSALLAHPARAHHRGLRVRRGLLQHHPPALDARLPLTRPVRDHEHDQHQQGERPAAKAPRCPQDRVHSNSLAPFIQSTTSQPCGPQSAENDPASLVSVGPCAIHAPRHDQAGHDIEDPTARVDERVVCHARERTVDSRSGGTVPTMRSAEPTQPTWPPRLGRRRAGSDPMS
jgi:hypothetical protein